MIAEIDRQEEERQLGFEESAYMHIFVFEGHRLMSVENDILKIIEAEAVGDQAALASRLVSKGHVLTQSTLSRKLKALGVRKMKGRYVVPRLLASGDWENVEVVPVPPNLVVLRTAPGMANALGVQLDGMALEGIVGTVAGDDTLFLAVSPPELLSPLVKILRKRTAVSASRRVGGRT
jgi:transcriptional regulator of arginine metabolism